MLKNNHQKFRKEEKGAVAVITAVFMTIALGMSALAIDAGNWFVTQRGDQNASDAAALAAAEYRYGQNYDRDEAEEAASKVALSTSMNAAKPLSCATKEDRDKWIRFYWPGDLYTGRTKGITVASSKGGKGAVFNHVVQDGYVIVDLANSSKNFFYTGEGNRDDTDVSTVSVANVQYQKTTEGSGGGSYPVDTMIDAMHQVNWTGQPTRLNGDIYTAGETYITSDIKPFTGNIYSDGNVTIVPGSYTQNGNIVTGGDFLCTTANTTINGNLVAKGSATWNTSVAASTGIMGSTTAGGIVKTWHQMPGNNGTDFEAFHGHVAQHATDIEYTPYKWRWDFLLNYDAGNVTKDIINKYIEEKWDKSVNEYWNSATLYITGDMTALSLNTYVSTFDINDFFRFCQKETGKTNLHFDGSVTINGSANIHFPGMIITEGGLKFTSGDFYIPDNICFVAKTGDITIESRSFQLTGMLAAMGLNGNGGSVKPNNGGGQSNYVHGVCIAKNAFTMTSGWAFGKNDGWAKIVPPNPDGGGTPGKVVYKYSGVKLS